MGRSLVKLAAACVLAAGCNQVFGIHPTQLQDSSDLPSIDAPAPVMVVQTAAAEVKRDVTNALAFDQPIAAGNMIVACVYTESATVVSVHDTLGTTYVQVVGPVALPVFTANMYIYAAIGVAGGSDTVSVDVNPNQGSTSPSIELYIHELANVAAIDGGTGTSGTSQDPDGSTSGTLTTHAANEMIFGFGVASGVMAAGTGFVTFSTFDNNVTEGRLVTAPGSYAATGTSTGPWALLAAGFAGH